MKSTFKQLFYIRKDRVKPDGRCNIMVRLTIDGEISQFSSKLSVFPKTWNQKMGRAEGKNEETKLLNVTLDKISTSINTHYIKLSHTHAYVTADMVKNSFLGTTERQKTLLHFFDLINKQQKELVGIDIGDETYEKYLRSKEKMQSYLKSKYGLTDILISNVNHDFVKNYEIYLKTNGCGVNQTGKYMQWFKKVISYAFNNGDINKHPFANYKIHFEEVDKDFLTENELKILIEKKLPSNRLNHVKDVFLFCCFTGLAYRDTFDLTENDIVSFNGDDVWINTRRKKTNTPTKIPLLPVPLYILEKYRGQLPPGKILPIKSCQKMNDYLKEIADLCGINKDLTTHVARHTSSFNQMCISVLRD